MDPARQPPPTTTTPHSPAGGGRRTGRPSSDDHDPVFRVRVLGLRGPLVVSGPPDARIAQIATRQRGRLNRAQLAAAGITPAQVRSRVGQGRLIRRHLGVYAAGHLAEPELAAETEALLACRGTLLGRASAARVWELPCPRPDVVHLLGERAAIRHRGAIVVHAARLAPGHAAIHAGLPVTSIERTLVDLAGLLEPRRVERAVEDALIRRLTTGARLARLLEGDLRPPGTAALRRLLASRRGPAWTREESEVALLALIRDAGLPEPVVNGMIGAHEVDFHWPGLPLVVELDGFRFHSTRARFEQDRRKQNALVAMGYVVMRVTWRRIESDPVALVAELARALTRAELLAR